MALDFDNLIFKSFDRFTYASNATGELYFIIDEISDNGTLSNSEDVVYGLGSNGRRISSMKRNKTASYTVTNGFFSMKQTATQSGTETEVATTATITSPVVEILEVNEDGTEAITSFAATGTAGAEILALYKANKDGTQGVKYKQGATASATAFAYDPATKKITLPTDVFAKGDRVIVYYNYLTKGKRVANRADKFSKDGRGILEGTVCAPCDQETLYPFKLVIPYASTSGAYDIALNGDSVSHPFTIESLPNPCDKKADLWFLVVEDDEE